MGILNQPETASVSTPAFETEEETMSAPTAEVQEQATTAIAAAKSTAVASPRPTIKMAFADQKDAFPVDVVAALSQSTPRIKGEQGEAYIEQTSLGKKFRMTVESWNTRKLISAGLGQNDPGYKESIEYLRTSYDMKTVHNDGQTVEEYIEYLKSLQYEKAKASDYGDIWGFVTWTEKEGDIPPEKMKLHLLQASQTSLGAFQGFCTTQGLLAMKGITTLPETLEVHAEARSKGTMKFTNFSFHSPSVKK